MKKASSIIVIILFTISNIIFFNDVALSWTESTHKDLSIYAAENSILNIANGDYLKNLGIENELEEYFEWDGNKRKIRNWIAEGAEFEDMSDPLFPLFGTTRSVNHFHNPLKPWSQAGLDDWILLSHYTGESSLLWAQDSGNQSTYIKGDWSWQTLRDYYYLALTSNSDSDRQANFAKLFKGLGHQMHLIQDSAQPDHVRNDAHPEDSFSGIVSPIGFEKWAGRNAGFINSLASNPLAPNVSLNISYASLAPVTQFIDTDQYNGTNPDMGLTQGISEYTNANFFSDDTIFAAEQYQPNDRHYFPYPKNSSTDLQSYISQNKLPETVIGEDNIPDTAVWIRKTGDGEIIDHFVRPSYLSNKVYSLYGDINLYRRTFYRDEKCHEDYAQKLIPRAVGYSSALIDYFFRGNIDMIPDAMTGTGYVIVNKAEEDMDGTFEIYYDSLNDDRIQIWSGDITLGSLSSGNNSSNNIAFPGPRDTKVSGSYMLVFRGRMGYETNAVVGKIVGGKRIALIYSSDNTLYSAVVKMHDISECNNYSVNVLGAGLIDTDFHIANPNAITGNVIFQQSFTHNNEKIYLMSGLGLEIDSAFQYYLHNEILDRYDLVDLKGTMLYHPGNNKTYYLSTYEGLISYISNNYIFLGGQVSTCTAVDGSSCRQSGIDTCWHYWIYSYDPVIDHLTKHVETCIGFPAYRHIGDFHHFSDDGKAYHKNLFPSSPDWYDDLWTHSSVELGAGFLDNPLKYFDRTNACLPEVWNILSAPDGASDYAYYCLNDDLDYVSAVSKESGTTGITVDWISHTDILSCLGISTIFDIKWMGFLE